MDKLIANNKQLDNIDRVTNTLVEVGALISKLEKLYDDIADEDYNSGTNVERFMPGLSSIFSHSLDEIDYHKVIEDFSHFAQDIEGNAQPIRLADAIELLVENAIERIDTSELTFMLTHGTSGYYHLEHSELETELESVFGRPFEIFI